MHVYCTIRTFILIPLCLVYGFVQAQTMTKKNAPEVLRNQLAKADRLLKEQKFHKAIKGYDRIITRQPRFIDAWINKGTALYELHNWQSAVQHYQKAIELDSSYMGRLHFTVGMILFKQERYGESLDYFAAYIKHPKSTPARKEVAEKNLELARFRQSLMDHPVEFEPMKLPGAINTDMSEFLPALTAENVMVFSRKVSNQEDLYYTIRKDHVWQVAQPIRNLNTEENEAAHSISADGNWLAFTICNREESMGSCDLMISRWNGQKWSLPKNMGAPINTTGWEGQPSLSAHGDYMIFVSNRAGGYGDYDLWISFRKSNSWSNPVNLGPGINTKARDETPFIHADGQTLYFSSNGHPGMGDHDLFVVRRNAQDDWGKPINLGFPINTKNKEGALSVSLDGSTAYFSTDRLSSMTNPNLDIYAFQMPDDIRPQPVTYVKVSLVDDQQQTPVFGQVNISNLTSNRSTDSLLILGEESPVLCLPLGKQYAFHARAAEYIPFTKNLDLEKIAGKTDPLILTIPMQKIEVAESKPVILENIFFETGSSQLLDASTSDLQLLLYFLKTNSEVRVEIRGHTDNTGSPEFNQNLSEDRAGAVYQYLIKHGIDHNRLSYTGYGATYPIDTNDTADGRQNNRRTEFRIIHE